MLYFAKENEEVKIPTKRQEDAGYDIYAYFEAEEIIIEPHTVRIIPTGLHSAFDSDKVLMLKDRSSTGKLGINVSGGIIDSGYRGEIGVPILNNSDATVIISKKVEDITFEEHDVLVDTKVFSEESFYQHETIIVYPYNKAICQGLLLSVPITETKELTLKELMSISSERGDGAFGSSNK